MKTVLRMFLVVVITSLSCATVFCQSSGGGSSGGGSYPPAWPDPYEFFVNNIHHSAQIDGPVFLPQHGGQPIPVNVVLRDPNSSNHNFTQQASYAPNLIGAAPSAPVLGSLTSPVGQIHAVVSTNTNKTYGPAEYFLPRNLQIPPAPGFLQLLTTFMYGRYVRNLYAVSVVAQVDVPAPTPSGFYRLTLQGNGAFITDQFHSERSYAVVFNGGNG